MSAGPSPTTAKETSPLSTNPYDAFRKVVEAEANQDDDGGFFAKLGGLEPEPEDDGPTAKGLFQHIRCDNGGKLPAGLGIIRNATGKREHITTWDEYREHLLKINRNPRYLKPIVKVRRGMTYYRNGYGYMWNWTCRLCYHKSGAAYWDLAYESATHHAHNHHRSQ